LLLYHIHSALSIPFAKVFSNFFKEFFLDLSYVGAVSLYIVPPMSFFVKHFLFFF